MAIRKRFVCPYCGIAALALVIGAVYRLSWSEQFYLAVPMIFVVRSVSIWSHDKREGRARVTAIVVGSIILLAVAVWDGLSPSVSFGVFGRTVYAYAFVAVVVTSTWLYVPVGAAIRRLSRQTEDRQWRRFALRAAGIVVYSFVFYAYLLSFLQTHMPKRTGNGTPADLHLAFEDVSWSSRDGVEIAGWYVPNDASDRAVILCHGVGADKSDMLPFALALHEGGYSVLALDFRSHGSSGGYTISYGGREKWDIISGVDFLRREHPARAKHVFGVGWSMGAVCLVLAGADDERIEGLHLDAVFATSLDMAKILPSGAPPVYRQVTPYLATTFACMESGVNLFGLSVTDAINQVTCPVMIVHGEKDGLIPIAQGRRVFEAANQPKSWRSIPGADHCQTIGVESPRYEAAMIAFLDSIAGERE